MRTPLSRVLVGTAVTATALFTLAGTADAATVKTPTQLSIAESAASITVGQTDVITGTLTANGKALAKKPVVLEQLSDHSWHAVGARVTNDKGSVAFYRQPRQSATFKLAFFGTSAYAQVVSGTVSVTVKPVKKITTALSIAESATSITVGQTDVITGTLTANGKALPKRAVILDRWVHARWVPVAAKATNATGVVKFAAKPMSSASYRLFYHGDAKYAPASSGSVKVTVTKIATALAATESAATIKAGQKDTIQGTLTKGSTPLAKQLVWIYRLVAGKKPYPVQVHLTNAKGLVSFTVMPKATTSYELVYFGTKMLAGSVSSTVTVTVS